MKPKSLTALGVLLLVLAPVVRGAAGPTAPAAATAAASAAAAPAAALGLNLDYQRVRQVPADLSAAPAKSAGSLVLDLRFAASTSVGGTDLAAWLKSRARAETPVIVLVNPGTAPALLDALAPATLPAGVTTIGPAAAGLATDIAVAVGADADRAAYDAREKGVPLADLVTSAVDKTRYDEASLARDIAKAKSGEPKAPAAKKTPAAPAPPVDLLLQRAVQLHRTLLALGRLQ